MSLLCILFHPIATINNNLFIDKVSGQRVGRFHCFKCNVTYMANSKRSFFRVKLTTTDEQETYTSEEPDYYSESQ